ncbi:MAG: FAD-dependent oxidoreductase [Bacilli bacterium]|nr:FAD-dependent oxidoreductase [Bacilli bacterium]MDD4547250.1 FAD-dependent oxidoreductase [Bacilli bacterium]
MLNFDCVVIGSGPAGMTAAIYLRRANLNVAIIEKGAPGGLMNNIINIENYPGFTKVEGPTLSMNMNKQVTDLNVTYKYGNVISVEDFGEYKIVKTETEEIKSKAVIIASGRVPRKLGLENEDKLVGRGIGFCALCDGFFFKDKPVAVVGGGNGAVEAAIYLSTICSEVFLIHRREELTADKATIDKMKNRSNIKVKYNSVVSTIIPEDDKLKGIEITTDDQTSKLEVDGMFIYIGQVPDTSYLDKSGVKLDNKYVLVDKTMRTNIKNIYACGDVIKKEIYQITTAIGEGTIAASSATKDIN